MINSSAAMELRKRIAAWSAARKRSSAASGIEPALDELRDDPAHAQMDDQLRQDEQRHDDQKAHMRFDIADEGDRHAAEQRALDEAQQQQGHPDDTADDDDTPQEMILDPVFQMRLAEKLIQRPTEHQREVVEFGPVEQRARVGLFLVTPSHTCPPTLHCHN